MSLAEVPWWYRKCHSLPVTWFFHDLKAFFRKALVVSGACVFLLASGIDLILAISELIWVILQTSVLPHPRSRDTVSGYSGSRRGSDIAAPPSHRSKWPKAPNGSLSLQTSHHLLPQIQLANPCASLHIIMMIMVGILAKLTWLLSGRWGRCRDLLLDGDQGQPTTGKY